eukprot:127228-Rhodomonas_salina.2
MRFSDCQDEFLARNTPEAPHIVDWNEPADSTALETGWLRSMWTAKMPALRCALLCSWRRTFAVLSSSCFGIQQRFIFRKSSQPVELTTASLPPPSPSPSYRLGKQCHVPAQTKNGRRGRRRCRRRHDLWRIDL